MGSASVAAAPTWQAPAVFIHREAPTLPLRDVNAPARRPAVTIALILLNTGLFVWTASRLGEERQATQFLSVYGLVPATFLAGFPAHLEALVTSMFLHGGVMHLAGNMWFLWVFADNVEDRLGRWRFLLFFLGTGVVAGLVHVAIHPDSQVPTIGASGAVSGALGAYIRLYPKARVITLVPLGFFFKRMALPAFLFLGLWFGLQLVSGVMATAGDQPGGVAWWAHAGGFVAGALGVSLFTKTGNRRWLRRVSD